MSPDWFECVFFVNFGGNGHPVCPRFVELYIFVHKLLAEIHVKRSVSRTFIRVRDGRTSPASHARTFVSTLFFSRLYETKSGCEKF